LPDPDIPLSPPAPSAPSATLLFFGEDGLRAGWSVLLYITLVILTGTLIFSILGHLHLIPDRAPSQLLPKFAAVEKLIEFSIFALPALLMSFIERRPFSRYGFSLRRMLPDFLSGLFWGFAALSLLVGVLALTHNIAFDGFTLHGAAALRYASLWALAFFLVGLSEEFTFRGYLQYTVARGVAGITRAMDPGNRHAHLISFWVSAFLFSFCFFILGHVGNGGENLTGLFLVGLAGIVFAFSLYRTGTLWWAIGLHTAWDWAQSYFYGTPDSGNLVIGHLLASHPIGPRLLSGGPDGPEGSVLGIPTLLLVALVIHLTLPKRTYPVTHDQSPPETDILPQS
jgi:membrane protease YdiL (CAAX protease family)